MDFELTQEQRMLADAAAQFAKKTSPVERLRKLRWSPHQPGDPRGWQTDVWKQMAELGWLGLLFPERVGGLGLSLFDASLVIEKLGTTLVPEPFVPSVVLAGTAVLRAGDEAQQKALLEPMIEGRTSLALAWGERASRYDASLVRTTAKKDGASYLLDGEKSFVLNGHAADTLVVSARTDAGLALFAVDPKTPGVSVTPLNTMDGQRAAIVRLEHARVEASQLLGEPGDRALAALEAALDAAAAASCAEGYGIASTVLEMTSAYLKQRKQFGVAIGVFQALQHRAVDMFVEVELMKSTALWACVKADSEDAEERRRAIAIGKYQLCAGGRFVTQQAIQLHGGIGITDEHDVGLYFKRMRVLEALYGDEEHHVSRFASRAGFADSVG